MTSAFDLAAAQDPEAAQTIACAECGHRAHSLFGHLREVHNMSPEQYLARHPGSRILSPFGERAYKDHLSQMTVSATREVRQVDIDSIQAFGVGFGKEGKTPKNLRGYSGYTREDGVPEIDEHYQFDNALTRDILMGMMSGGRIYALGPTGSGKTSIFNQITARLGRPWFRQQCHGEMEPSEVLGTWTVGHDGAMLYLYSGLALAIQQPSVVCFDEFDSGNPPVTAILNALLEGNPLVLPNKGGEKIYPHPDCIFVATGNTNGMGDETGLYTSTTPQSFATMNRFRMFVVIDYMDADQEKGLLKKIFGQKGLPDQEITDIVKVANLVRDAFKGNKCGAVMSTRQVLNWAQFLMMTGDPTRSFQLAFANQLGIVDRKVCEELYQRVFGRRA